MLDIIPNFLCAVLAYALPIYAAHKVLSTNPTPSNTSVRISSLVYWLTYFLVLNVVNAVESLIPPILLFFLPFYAWIRLFIHLYLLLPSEKQGASFIYTEYIAPFFFAHETQIERIVATLYDRVRSAGVGQVVDQIIDIIRTRLMGLQPLASNAPTPDGRTTTTPSNYVSQILGFLSTEATSPSTAPYPSTTRQPTAVPSFISANLPAAAGGLVSAMGGALSQLATSPTPTSTATPVATAASSADPTMLSPAERLRFIEAEKANLKAMMEAYEKEAGHIQDQKTAETKQPHGSDGASDEASAMRPSRSEGEFVNVVRDESVEAAGAGGVVFGGKKSPSQTKSGSSWSSWLWGGEDKTKAKEKKEQ